jgi:anti-anti-sigma factor
MLRPMDRFAVKRSEEGDRLRLSLFGELDLYAAPELDDALVDAEGEKWPVMALDLSELEFVDSSGLRLIMRTQARAQHDARRLIVLRGREAVDRVFRLTGLDAQLELVDAIEDDAESSAS